jgi:hypothetical protein
LGEVLFDLDELMQPDPRLVPASISPECDLQWMRFRLDLSQAAVAAMQDAGADIDDAGSEPPDASPRADASTRDDAGSEDRRRSDDGCSCRLARRHAGDMRALPWLALAALALRRRRMGRKSR